MMMDDKGNMGADLYFEHLSRRIGRPKNPDVRQLIEVVET